MRKSIPSPPASGRRWQGFGLMTWLRRTLEMARLQSAIDEKRRWMDELHRQMGERLAPFGEPLPDAEELQAWRESLRRSRQEIAYLQQRRRELDQPDLGTLDYDTKPRMISGGALARIAPESVPVAGGAYTSLNPIPETTVPPVATPEEVADVSSHTHD